MTNAAATRPSRTQFFALIICDPLEKSDNKLSFLRLIWDPVPYLWAGPRELGAEDPDPDPVLIRGPAVLPAGAETRDEPPAGNRAADAADGARMVPLLDPGDADTGLSACCEIRPKLRTLPRATPRPAESLRIADLP